MSRSTREQVFVEAYLQCWNATEAARRAGYKNPNKIGPRKLVEVGIRQAIAARISELKATADEVLLRLASHSRGSMEHFLRGETIDLEQARARGLMHLVKKIKVTTTTDGEAFETHRVELELYDAQAATVQLGKMLGQFVEHVRITDWRTDVVELLRSKKITPEAVRDELGDDLATELFNSAGISVSQS